LQKILPHFGIDELNGADLDELTLAWHRLDAWPDVSAGLARLRQRFLVAPVSNGNIALMCDLARRNDFRWDAILGADLARDFKPKAVVYAAAADAFGFKTGDCMMCAAHGSDLKAAAATGMRTAFIARPAEPPGFNEGRVAPQLDISCGSCLELAAQLGV
jgi:2-haloacid dehalogenase